MTENLQAQFKTEGQPAFPVANTENENSAESPTEKTESEQTQPQEGETNSGEKKDDANKKEDDNLADHPRWKEREDDWKKRFNEQETRQADEIQKLRVEIEDKLEKKETTKTEIEVPSWWGGDEEQWGQFLGFMESQVINKAQNKALENFENRTKSEQEAIDKATQYFNNEIKSIESDKSLNPNGLEVDRNKILKFALDNDIVDSKGRWNYRAAFKFMGADQVFKAKEALNERKKIANAITSENRGETKQPEFKTSADFKKPGERPW